MTQKQFKEALLRGQGRCIQAVQAEPEKYFNLVLWACNHELSFDTQCEGTRAWFVYQLVKCYQNKTPFLEKAVKSFENIKSNGGWKMLYLAELLSHFSDDGNKIAEQALWCKYEKLYNSLMARKRPKEGVFSEKDDFVMLGNVLAKDKESFIKIAEDIGRLYRKKSFYDGFDFDWLHDSKGKQYISVLTRQTSKSKNMVEFLRVGQIYEKECEEIREKRIESTPKKGVALSRWLKMQADRETILQYAQTYLDQSNLEERAEALTAFCNCPYPENPAPIIEDTKSNCEELKVAAWRALENIRHPLVRKFALWNLQNDVETSLPVFIKNFQEQDANLLDNLVKSVPVEYDGSTEWHGIHLDVLGMVDDGLKAPASLLKYIYENTYCSNCREYALRQMGKRRMLTKEILQECLFDSNDEIRTYAEQCLKRRK